MHVNNSIRHEFQNLSTAAENKKRSAAEKPVRLAADLFFYHSWGEIEYSYNELRMHLEKQNQKSYSWIVVQGAIYFRYGNSLGLVSYILESHEAMYERMGSF